MMQIDEASGGHLITTEVIWDLTSTPGTIYLPLPCCLSSLSPQSSSPVMEGDSSAREQQSHLHPRSSAGAVSGSSVKAHIAHLHLWVASP